MTTALTDDLDVLLSAWGDVLRLLGEGDQAMAAAAKVWLEPGRVRAVEVNGGELTLECPTPLYRLSIERRLGPRLLALVADVLGRPMTEIRFRISPQAVREHEARRRQAEQAAGAGHVAPAEPATSTATAAVVRSQGLKLLEHFVVGNANRIAYDAVCRLLEEPRKAVNPLFIHGKSGLGKTHLEQGLAQAFRERYPKARVTYIRCEQFTNDWHEALRQRGEAIQAFRVKMRHPDLLLIDDVHFLSTATLTAAKKELFATFDEMTSQGKLVVFTSDASPRAIQNLEESFVQRFGGGLVVELQRPDPLLRAGVVRAKAQQRGLEIPEPVVEYLAEHITDNMRELEGAVNKLEQHARSFARQVDLGVARQALSDLIVRGADETIQDLVLREVAERFGVEARDLVGNKRSGPLPLARHVAMYLLKEAGDESYERIGRLFGDKGHSTVIYSCNQVRKLRGQDEDLERFISDILVRARRY